MNKINIIDSPAPSTAEQSFSLWTSWLKGVNAEQRETNTGGAEVTWLTNGEARNSRIDPEEHFVLWPVAYLRVRAWREISGKGGESEMQQVKVFACTGATVKLTPAPCEFFFPKKGINLSFLKIFL